MEEFNPRKVGALGLAALFVTVEMAYFSGIFGAADGEHQGWYLIGSPLLIPFGIVSTGTPMIILGVSLLVRNERWRWALVAIALVLQFVLWPSSPDCPSYERACDDPLQSFRYGVIFFWLVGAAFHAIHLVNHARESNETNPYMQQLREHNEAVRKHLHDD